MGCICLYPDNSKWNSLILATLGCSKQKNLGPFPSHPEAWTSAGRWPHLPTGGSPFLLWAHDGSCHRALCRLSQNPLNQKELLSTFLNVFPSALSESLLSANGSITTRIPLIAKPTPNPYNPCASLLAAVSTPPSFQECCVNGITQDGSFWFWLFKVSIIDCLAICCSCCVYQSVIPFFFF